MWINERLAEKKRNQQNIKKGFSWIMIYMSCIIIGWIMRIMYYVYYPVQPRDAFAYANYILKWEETGIAPDFNGRYPFGIWLMKIPYHYFSYKIIEGALLVNFILGLLIIVLFISTTKTLYQSNLLAFIAGILCATHPTLIRYSCSVLRENSYLFFSFFAIRSMINYIKHNSISNIIGMSISSVFALLCRLEAIEMFPFCVLVLLGNRRLRRGEFRIACFHLFVLIFSSISFLLISCRFFEFKNPQLYNLLIRTKLFYLLDK